MTRAIFHYTNTKGLFEIVRTRKLWLTSGRHLNDYSEGQHAFDRLIEAAENQRSQAFQRSNSDEPQLMIESAGNLLDVLETSTYVEMLREAMLERSEAFVASFSRNDDLLSQWRAYADNGRGVSIGLDPSWLKNPQGCDGDPLLFPVRYNEPSLEELQGLGSEHLERASFAVTATNYIWSTKNPAFAEEQEIRILLRPRPTNDYQSNLVSERMYRVDAAGNLIPYYELAFPPEALVSVRLGPKSTIDPKTLREFLTSNGSAASIGISKATYR